jgi:hypothetical protein
MCTGTRCKEQRFHWPVNLSDSRWQDRPFEFALEDAFEYSWCRSLNRPLLPIEM